MKKKKNIVYYEIDFESLREGTITDRPIFAFLPINNRIIQLLAPFQVIDSQSLQKMKGIKQIFSIRPSIHEKAPRLIDTVKQVGKLLDDSSKIVFEKNRAIFEQIKWIAPLISNKQEDYGKTIAVFFIYNLLNAPTTYSRAQEESPTRAEQSLKVAALTSLLALFLGYSEREFLIELTDGVFCLETGAVPGVTLTLSSRIELIYAHPQTMDDLRFLRDLAKNFCGLSISEDTTDSRVYKKIKNLWKITSLETAA